MFKDKNTDVLLISGSVGVGKSTVADEVYETLKRRSLPIALINLDELGYANVDLDDYHGMNLRFKNLVAIWPNYAQAGVTHVVVPYLVEDKATIERFMAAIPGANIHTVLLEASVLVIKQRLSQKPMGGDLAWHLKRAEELPRQLHGNDFLDFSIDTDSRSVKEIADSLITNWQSAWT